jgi:hypothetical protein
MRLTIRVALLVCALLAAATAQAYDNPQEYLEIPFIDVVPELDDFAEMKPAEHLEGKMALVTGFIQREPNNGGVPAFDTKVYVAYDRQRLYAVFVAFDDEPEKIRANMAPRDDVFNDDSVNIMIDTFNDQQRAYFFLSTPRGVQAEGQFIEGRGFDGSFDAVWDADGRLTDRGYIVRIAVPFVAIRFPRTDEQTWRVIFNRTIPRLSEDNFWPEYSREIEGRLNQTAIVTGIRDISPGRNIQLAPFVFARDFRLETEDPTGKTVDKDDEQSIGLDAKFVIKDALVLDLTVNPDFSQVEADLPQPTVNQRFEVFFPEQRPFFLENADAFRTPTNLFFSRRIVDPSAGIKLTGRQGRYGIGVLFADDQAPGKGLEPGDPLRDEHALVGVVRVSRDFSEQSRIGMMFTDRELDTSHNRVAAIDGRIKHNDNWVTEFQLAGSGTRTLEGEEQDGTSLNAVLNRRGLHLNTHTHYLYTSPGFQTDLGFLGGQQRPDSQDFHQDVGWRFRPTDSKVTEWGPNFFVGRVWDTDGRKLDSAVRASKLRHADARGVSRAERAEGVPAEQLDRRLRHAALHAGGIRLGRAGRRADQPGSRPGRRAGGGRLPPDPLRHALATGAPVAVQLPLPAHPAGKPDELEPHLHQRPRARAGQLAVHEGTVATGDRRFREAGRGAGRDVADR